MTQGASVQAASCMKATRSKRKRGRRKPLNQTKVRSTNQRKAPNPLSTAPTSGRSGVLSCRLAAVVCRAGDSPPPISGVSSSPDNPCFRHEQNARQSFAARMTQTPLLWCRQQRLHALPQLLFDRRLVHVCTSPPMCTAASSKNKLQMLLSNKLPVYTRKTQV